MTKPDDIPQDVWDEAEKTARAFREAGFFGQTAEPIARTMQSAALAEREACAKLILNRAESHEKQISDAWQKDDAERGLLRALLQAECLEIADALTHP